MLMGPWPSGNGTPTVRSSGPPPYEGGTTTVWRSLTEISRNQNESCHPNQGETPPPTTTKQAPVLGPRAYENWAHEWGGGGTFVVWFGNSMTAVGRSIRGTLGV